MTKRDSFRWADENLAPTSIEVAVFIEPMIDIGVSFNRVGTASMALILEKE